MFKLNMKIALRNLLKHKVYTLINILGLSVGMASCILIYIFIQFQLSFDKSYKNDDRIYRFVTDWRYDSFIDNSSGAPIPFAEAARTELPELDKVAIISGNGGVVSVKDSLGKEKIKAVKDVFFAEPAVFDIFDLNWLSAKPGKEFAEPNTVVISETTAKQFFGSAENAIGKSFTFWTHMNLKVIAVFEDVPVTTSIPFRIVISFSSSYIQHDKSWDNVSSQTQCFALIKKGIDRATLQASLARFNKTHFTDQKIAGNQISVVQSLSDIHFSERYGNFSGTGITKKQIYGLAIIGLFLLVTACINFINLATAQSVNRSKEVGVRKVMGSKRKQLIVQFLTETLAVTLLSLLIACILSELALPAMQNLFKGEVVFSLFGHPLIIVFMVALVIFVSFLAGFYPAMVMSGFSPALAIKNKVVVNAGSLSLRKVLVVVQFAITIVLIISTIVIMEQMQYVREKPLGFNSRAVALVDIPGDSTYRTRMEGFRERVLTIPGVEMASYCVRPPLSGSLNTTNFSFNGRQNTDFEVRLTPSDEHYFKLFDLKFIAGKEFLKSDTATGYVANETFLRKVGITDPQAALGKIIDQNGHIAPIVGVVKDFNDQSLQESISPMIFYQSKRQYYKMAVKLNQQGMLTALKEIESLWISYFPTEVYEAKFLDEDMNRYYETERIMGSLFKVFAGVIIFISFIGLFGLISFVATQRTKEVAIRKVLGASTFDLVKMLNGSFMLMVFMANIIAWPLAYLFVSRWLSGFAYRMDLSAWPFVLAMCISMLITLVTVSIRSFKAATANTIDALKYE